MLVAYVQVGTDGCDDLLRQSLRVFRESVDLSVPSRLPEPRSLVQDLSKAVQENSALLAGDARGCQVISDILGALSASAGAAAQQAATASVSVESEQVQEQEQEQEQEQVRRARGRVWEQREGGRSVNLDVFRRKGTR